MKSVVYPLIAKYEFTPKRGDEKEVITELIAVYNDAEPAHTMGDWLVNSGDVEMEEGTYRYLEYEVRENLVI